jgi:hypothetical protein
MTSPAQRKGDGFERAVRDLLREELGTRHIFRNRMEGSEDRGDIGGIPGWTLQCKAYDDLLRSLREGMLGLRMQQAVTQTPYGAAICKRRGLPTGEAYFVMSLGDAIPVLRETARWPASGVNT